MDSYLEEDLFSDKSEEEQFIRDNLSFLVEPEEEFVETIRFIHREAQACVYGTSAMDFSVIESWSKLSSGSICSTKVKPSKFSSLYVFSKLFGDLPSLSLPKKSSTLDLTFLSNDLEGQTSTPIKSYLARKEVQNKIPLNLSGANDFRESVSTLKNRFGSPAPNSTKNCALGEPLDSTYADPSLSDIKIRKLEDLLNLSSDSWNSHSNGQVSSLKDSSSNENDHSGKLGLFSAIPLKSVKEAPIALLNQISKVNETIFENEYEEDKYLRTTLDPPKVHSKDFKPKSITLADFMQNKKVDDEEKENRLCKFCFKNGELPKIYASHETKTPAGIVICPILRKYVCDLCGETGDKAHTRKYCRLNTERFAKKPIFRRLSNGVLTTYHNHK